MLHKAKGRRGIHKEILFKSEETVIKDANLKIHACK